MNRGTNTPVGTKKGASPLAQFLTFLLDPFSGGRSIFRDWSTRYLWTRMSTIGFLSLSNQ